MKLNSLSVHCMISGSLSLTLGAVLLGYEFVELWLAATSDSKYKRSDIRDCCWKLAGFAAIAFISILKLVGVKKRMVFLLLPWLLAVCGLTACSIYASGEIIIIRPYDNEFIFNTIALFGFELLILYPLFKLIGEIRREKVNATNSQEKPIFVKF